MKKNRELFPYQRKQFTSCFSEILNARIYGIYSYTFEGKHSPDIFNYSQLVFILIRLKVIHTEVTFTQKVMHLKFTQKIYPPHNFLKIHYLPLYSNYKINVGYKASRTKEIKLFIFFHFFYYEHITFLNKKLMKTFAFLHFCKNFGSYYSFWNLVYCANLYSATALYEVYMKEMQTMI